MRLIVLFLVFGIVGCKEQKTIWIKKEHLSYDSFIFSLSNMSSEYSMKFTDSDSVFYEIRFPHPTKEYFCIIKSEDKIVLDSLIDNLHWSLYDTVNANYNVSDGVAMKFLLTKKNKTNWVYFYGLQNEYMYPKELRDLFNWVGNYKNSQEFYTMKNTHDYGNLWGVKAP